MIVNFSWLIDDKIAGFGQPGGINHQWEREPNELTNDLELLFNMGIRALVSLTEDSLDEDIFKIFSYLHLPINDMQPPTLDEVVLFIDFAEKMDEQKKPLGVHCRAGLGRTGTMLACYLVHKGDPPQAAITQIRAKRPGSIETLQQEEIIFSYAELIKKQRSDDLFMNLN